MLFLLNLGDVQVYPPRVCTQANLIGIWGVSKATSHTEPLGLLQGWGGGLITQLCGIPRAASSEANLISLPIPEQQLSLYLFSTPFYRRTMQGK